MWRGLAVGLAALLSASLMRQAEAQPYCQRYSNLTIPSVRRDSKSAWAGKTSADLADVLTAGAWDKGNEGIIKL